MTSNLGGFTDILGDADEIGNSQPLSLSPVENTSKNSRKPGPTDYDCGATFVRHERPKKHTGQHGNFRSVEEIDPKYREVFSYPYFNLVQSSVIEDALYSDKSMVVCAPTGSGKTVVFEMAIVQLLMALDDCCYTEDFKIIYMAPVKALCTERLTEWYSKFTKLGILCIEVTGDTDVEFSQLRPYRIIITTPEKWDMLTRRWRDHKSLVSTIKLFLIDEVHILNDEVRGPVLEAVVSRMKTIESSFQSAHRIELLQKQYNNTESPAGQATNASIIPGIRFVAVSATVANPQDVAAWLETKDKPAVYYKFGDECRPVKLKRVVEGYPCSEGVSIFKFDIILNYKLWTIINKYHDGKPTLIFCNTRKSVALTAETLSKEVTVSFSPEQKAKLTAIASTIKNKKLQSLVLNGVGCHHAGLLFEERLNIEQAFRNRDLPILITTTTLAMGVNLPAHLVIIKNTQQYVNGQYQEYSISTVLQMVGRAGRPQFDTEATAVIMTRMQDKPRYQALVEGSEPLQSYLHKRLAENLNSEAALGTVNDVAQCVQWLRSTFLCVRAAKDPKRYLGLTPTAPAHLITKKLEELCVKAMNSLASTGLISMDEASCIESTEAGRLMSVFYLDLETMKHMMKISGSETLEKLLWLICESHELADMHLRVDERRTLNLLNRNNAAATIRYPMKGKINSRQMKLYCIIQAVLGCLPISEPSLNQEAMKIMRIADRVCKCLVAYVTRSEIIHNQPQYFSAVLNSIVLAKCIAAHMWDNSPYVSKQLKGIGITFSTLLASAGKTNFVLLEESHPRDLERIMNKGPPAGNVIRKQISLLPKYQLTAIPVDENVVTIQLMLLNLAYLSENMDNLTAGGNHKSYIVAGDSENHLLLLTQFKDKDLITVYDGIIKYNLKRIHNFEHKILVHCISSNFVGIDSQCDYTFKDISPLYSRGDSCNPCSIQEQTPKKANKVQTTLTDTYKQRKRKNADTDIAQSKEKIKRDTNLIEKFKNLKESFGAATKNIKASLHNTSEMTNKLINDNFASHSPAISEYIREDSFSPSINQNKAKPVYEPTFVNASEYKNVINGNTITPLDKQLMMLQNKRDHTEFIPRTNEYFTGDNDYPEMVPEDNYDNDFIVDEHIEDILSEIENEISKDRTDSRKINIISDITLPRTNMNVNRPNSNFAMPKETTGEYYNIQLKDKPTNLTQKTKLYTKEGSYKPVETRKRKSANTKSNYSFIDKIEKKYNDESEETDPGSKSGFSDAIKKDIEKFLSNAKTSANKTDTITRELIGIAENVNKNSQDQTNNDLKEIQEVTTDPFTQLNSTDIEISDLPDVCVDSERKINPRSIKDTCGWLQTDVFERPSILDNDGERWSSRSYPNLTNDIEMGANCKTNIDVNENSKLEDYFKPIINTSHSEHTKTFTETRPSVSGNEDINKEIEHDLHDLKLTQGTDIRSVIAKFDQNRKKLSNQESSNLRSETELQTNVSSTFDRTEKTHKTDVKSIIALYDTIKNTTAKGTQNIFETDKSINNLKNSFSNSKTIDLTDVEKENTIDLTKSYTLDKSCIVDLTNDIQNCEDNNQSVERIDSEPRWKECKLSHGGSENINYLKSLIKTAKSNISINSISQVENCDIRSDENDKTGENTKTVAIKYRVPKPIPVYPYSDTDSKILNNGTEDHEKSTTMVPFVQPPYNIDYGNEVDRNAVNTYVLPAQYDHNNTKANKTIFANNDAKYEPPENLNVALTRFPYSKQNLNQCDKVNATEHSKVEGPSIDVFKAHLMSLSTHSKDRKQDSSINKKHQYINNYCFTGTKIDVSTKHTDEHQVQIIKRLKIDLDVTEIISKRNTEVHNNEKRQQGSRTLYSNPITRIHHMNPETVQLSNYFSKTGNLTSIQCNLNSAMNFLAIDDGGFEVVDNTRSYASNDNVVKNETSTLKNVHIFKPINEISEPKEQSNNDPMKTICKFDKNKLITDDKYLEKSMQNENKIIEEDCKLEHGGVQNRAQVASEFFPVEYIPTHKIANKKETTDELTIHKNNRNKILKLENHNENLATQKKPEPLIENRKVESILQKYEKVLRKNTIDFNKSTTMNLKNAPFINVPEKPRRPFKISEIHKTEMILPKTLEVEVSRSQRPTNDEVLTRVKGIDQKGSSNYNTQKDLECNEINSCITTSNRDISINDAEFNENITNLEKQCNAFRTDNFKIQNNTPLVAIHDEIPELDMTTGAQLEEVATNYNDDLDQDMFNPKALLQRFTEEKIDYSIIPPPMEFCDNDNIISYSPTICNEDSENLDNDQLNYEENYAEIYNSTENVEGNNNNQDVSVFEDVRNILTPSTEIETWTFSAEEFDESEGSNSNHILEESRTVMRNNTGVRQLRLAPDLDNRKAKLSQFRVPYKDKLRP